jgi:beta-lactamase class D
MDARAAPAALFVAQTRHIAVTNPDDCGASMFPTRSKDTLMPRTSLILAIAAMLPTAAGADAERAFSAFADITGADSTCIAVYDVNDDRYLVHGLEQCEERLSPCSTFKVPNALIGLETGVLGGPGDRKAWDGKRHSREVNNRDHDLASAIRHSVVWYFQDVALDIGPERMQAWLDAFEYGNRDITGGQDRFWLSSSLQISAFEQLRFMAALDAEALPASPENQAIVKEMLEQDENLPDGLDGAVYGKTGSCIGKPVDHGWFTGFYHHDERKYAFAVNVKGDNQRGWQARTIALEALKTLP